MPIDSPYRALLDALPQRERTVDIDGVTTAVFEYGPDDAPPIVFVHGFRGDHHGLEPVAAHLPGLRVIAPDLPGFGASDALPHATIDAYAAWLRAFVAAEAAAAGRAPAVLGHSFGSIVVAHAAAGGLDASRIVLVNPIATPALSGANRIASLLALGYYRAAAALPERAGLAVLGAPPIVRGMSAFMAKTRDRELRAWIHDQHDRYFSRYASRQAVLEAFDTSIRHTVGEVADRIRLPVQLIAADLDDITPLAQQHRLRGLLPDARLSVLRGVGHLVHYEQPREAAAIIRRFLAEPIEQPDEPAARHDEQGQ
ncbi:alpha/beta fold hydrolase [Agrococcus jenensis]|uniref:Pimeloyl-ACP methyl ester carboxylesterase n=1 Tax=Agrococcus jenensis TaxID=46353 RepID=A0A3N2AVB5_9MICO|nr:alpha/beta hydrolase [Agrococcus jenensis]ROR66969.1 pimeloyl-ACP methyl ester carboxylesterase [Agrococcus jenensis]